jgi:serine/threonine-protein kinase
MVMDWGIARRVDAASADTLSQRAPTLAPPDPLMTREGDVLGTPAYMAPEQARGEISRLGPATDVYALGAILYHMLTGQPPFAGFVNSLKREALARALERTVDAPPELSSICARAMAFDAKDRYLNAGELASEITVFLDGARRREQALGELQKAMAERHETARLRVEVARFQAEAKRALAPIRPSDPMEAKVPGWSLEDEAERLEREVAVRETAWIQAVQGALAVDPALPEALEALADHYKEKLTDAERAHRHADAARFELLLRAHDRGKYARFLSGDGALTLVTDPPGARVELFRYVARERRLHKELVGDLGVTPLSEVSIPRGSYMLSIQAPGRAEVRYPMLIERGEHWHGRAPDELSAYPIELPAQGELGPDDIYIPAGPCWTGGDPEATESLPGRRIWVDGFVLRRHPLTNRELLDFLIDIAASGRSGEALGYPPGQPGPLDSLRGHPAFEIDAAGHLALRRDGPVAWRLDGPAPMDWFMASAYALWLSERMGEAWRLPNELEREKAARGADGRLAPWGDHFDPAFACVAEGNPGEPAPEPVSGHPTDESPYGVRGLAGNMRDWCVNIWKREGPLVEGGRLRVDAAAADDSDFRAVRGGGWGSSIAHARAAARFASRPGKCMLFVGARLARSYPRRD